MRGGGRKRVARCQGNRGRSLLHDLVHPHKFTVKSIMGWSRQEATDRFQQSRSRKSFCRTLPGPAPPRPFT